MDLDEFTDRFFAVEKRLDLFSDRSGGVPWWDAVRYHVYESLFAALTGAPAVRPARRALPVRALGWIQRISLRMLLHFRVALFGYETMVLRAPREKKSGRPLDAGIDDIAALSPGRALTIDTFPHYYHLPRRASHPREMKAYAAIDRLMDELTTEFGKASAESDLRELIVALLTDFQSALAAYRNLLARVRPRLIVMTQNGMEKALFLAASEARIPLIEGQHGLIGRSHPAYSYPADVDYADRSTFPAVFLAFSDYWIRSCFYPAKRCVAVGNDHFAIGTLPRPTDPGAVMFVSADVSHDVLRDWVVRLARAIPNRRIIYKLHPNQLRASPAIQREFEPFKNVEVIDGSVSARALLPRVGHLVLIQSTVTLEALQAGRRVCILPFLNYQVHKELFECPAVTVTPTLEDLLRALDLSPDPAAPPTFFDRFDAAATSALLREMYDLGARPAAAHE